MTSLGLLEISLALVVICFIIFIGYLGKNKDGFPTNWPVVGMLPELLLNVYPNNYIYEWTTELQLKAQCNFIFKGPCFSNMKILVTADPANVHYIFSSNFNNFNKGSDFKSIFDVVIGNGIFNSDSDQWRDQRKTATMLINHRNFQKFMFKTTTDKIHNGLFSVLNDASEKLSILDLQDVFYRFTFDCTWNLIVGIDLGCLSTNFPDIPIAIAIDDIQEAVFYRNILPKFVWKLQRYLGVGQEKKLSRAKKTMDLIIGNYLKEKKEEMANENELEGTDLLTSYIHQGFEDGYLRDMVINMLLAGSRAICESLKLYPIVPLNRKHAIKSDILPSGHHVDPSTMIGISTYSMGRMPSIWGEHCLKYHPERWINDKGGIKHISSHKFFPISDGPRICLGKDMAFTQMKIVIVNIFQKFDIQVVEGQDLKYGRGISLFMKNGLKIKVAKT